MLRMYNKVIVDACFVSKLRLIDETCGLIEYFSLLGGECVLDYEQFTKSPCNHTEPECACIDDGIDNEDVIGFFLEYPGSRRLEDHYTMDGKRGDPHDLKILAYAAKEGNCLVLSCDKVLLELCEDLTIRHYCFKAGLAKLGQRSSEIFSSPRYNTAPMFLSGDDPFFHYPNKQHCEVCHPVVSCPYADPRV